MSFPAYPEYSPSGAEWLGSVPSHWEKLPLFALVQERDESNSGMRESNLLSLSFGQIVRKNIDDNDGLLPASFETYQVVEANDVIWRLTDLQNDKRSLRTAIARERGIITSAYLATRPTGIRAEFLNHLLRAYDLSKVFYSMGGGLRQSMKFADVKWLPVFLPTEHEQAAIISFLDRETAKIDALVEEQQRLIALLKEKRQAVISRAVTKGVKPDASMKDSGNQWLGEVPAHWGVRRLSSMSTKITNGYVGPTRDILVDEGVRYLQSLHIKRNSIKFDTPYFVRPEWSAERAKSILETGDVLIVQTGDIGQSAVVPPEFAGCNCHALIIVAPLRSVLRGDWLSWVLNSSYGVQSLLSIQTGALHPHLNCGNVKDLTIPLPPLAEQEAIVAYVKQQTNRFDDLIGEAEEAIRLLSERRAALISAAVTGKIDVRGVSVAKAELKFA